MKRINTWDELAEAIGPHLATTNPLEELKRAGIEPDDELAEGLTNGAQVRRFDPTVFERLQAEYGPPPPTRVHIGRGDVGPLVAVPVVPPEPPPSPTGYAGIASVDLAVLNDVLAEFWRVRTIPPEFTEARTASIISVDELRAVCTGVPDDAQPGRGRLTSSPIASASPVTPLNIHFDVAFEIPVSASVPASLVGVLRVEVPLDFQVDVPPSVRLSLRAIEYVQGALEVVGWSTIQPRSEEARVALQDKLTAGLRTALLILFYQANTLAFPRSLPIAKKKFPNSTVDLMQMGAVSVRRGGRDYVTVGINVETRREVDTPALATQTIPLLPDTLHAAVIQDFATDALSAVISSGDLAALFNRVIQRHVPLVDVVNVTVNSGRVVFDQGQLRVSLACVAVDACQFKKDLKFTASVTGTPAIENGTLGIATSAVDFDLDNSDAFLCTLYSGILGPLSVVINVGVLAFIAAFNPQFKDVDIPVAGTSDPLPGSDKVIDISLTRAVMTPGILTADGYVRLIADMIHTFVHLRIMSGLSALLRSPLAGASVDLFELDSPAPDGDDVNIPAIGETDEFTPKFEITTSTSYSPRADELLGTRTTDEEGYVRFVSVSNAVGGVAKETRTQEDLHSGNVTTTTKTTIVGEGKPDLAVTIRTKSGAVVATRRLVGLNVPGKRLGSFDNPVVVHVQQRPDLGLVNA